MRFELKTEELYLYVKNIFRLVEKCFLFSFHIIKRQLLLFSIVVLAAFSLSYFTLKQAPETWEAKLCCTYNDNHPRIFGEMIEHLDYLLSKNEYKVVAKILKMKEGEVKKISFIKAKNISAGNLADDYSTNKTPFYIYVGVLDKEVLPLFEQQILAYLNLNPISYKNEIKQKKKWASRILFYEEQLLKLDSLKNAIRTSYVLGNNNIGMNQQNNSVVDIYKQSDSFSFFLADIQYYHQNYKSVDKAYDIMIFKNSKDGSIIKKAFLGSFYSFCILYFILLFINIYKKRTIQ